MAAQPLVCVRCPAVFISAAPLPLTACRALRLQSAVFDRHVFCLSGTFRATHRELKQLIEECGGELCATVSRAVCGVALLCPTSAHSARRARRPRMCSLLTATAHALPSTDRPKSEVRHAPRARHVCTA